MFWRFAILFYFGIFLGCVCVCVCDSCPIKMIPLHVVLDKVIALCGSLRISLDPSSFCHSSVYLFSKLCWVHIWNTSNQCSLIFFLPFSNTIQRLAGLSQAGQSGPATALLSAFPCSPPPSEQGSGSLQYRPRLLTAAPPLPSPHSHPRLIHLIYPSLPLALQATAQLLLMHPVPSPKLPFVSPKLGKSIPPSWSVAFYRLTFRWSTGQN